jgi:hypothetical protein
MLAHWENFYLITGGAAGALIGLMFVVVSLTSYQSLDSALRGTSVYMSPVILQYALVLGLSGAATAPLSPTALAVVLAAAGAAGFVAAARVTILLRTGRLLKAAHWSDVWWYGVWPAVAYAGLGASAAAVWLSPARAPGLVALAIVALLLIAIRNAWDLIIWVTPRAKAPSEP